MRPEHWLYTIPLRLRSLFHSAQADQELDDELRDHLERKTGEYIAQGMTQEEAHRRARLDLGGIEQTKEKCRDARRVNWIQNLVQDLRYGVRTLRKSPGFTIVAVLTLALGLAAVNTIFAVVETVLLRPLNFPHSDRVFVVSQRNPALGSGPTVVTLHEFQRWQESGLFERAAAMDTKEYTLLGTERAERLFGVRVTPDFFQVFGVRPFLGRGFMAEDATPGHDHRIVLSHQLWMRSFGGDRSIIGKSIRMGEGSMTVIGVMPPRFDFPRLADVQTIMFWAPGQSEFWAPLTITEKLLKKGGNFNYYVLGRLKEGVNARRAAEQFQASALQLFRDYELQDPSSRELFERILPNFKVEVTPLRDSMSWGIRKGLWMLLSAVGLLLVLVLFNLSNLLLTRHVGRLREFVLRQTLGASRWQVSRQSVAEQVLVVAGAALISLLLAEWGVSAIRSAAGARLPRLYDLSIDAHVTLLLVGLSFAIAIVFGSLPMVVLPTSVFSSVLQTEGRASTADRRTNRLKSGLMVVQIGMSMVLLIGAGLLIQSFSNVMRVNPGFDPHNLLNISVSLNPRTNQDPARRLAHVRELLDAFRIIPGVESAAVVNEVPLTGETDINNVRAVGGSVSSSSKSEGAEYRVVDASYFRTMHIPLVAGREFREDEPTGFAMVNRKMASRLWPDEDAVGKQVRKGDDPPVTVVGVVGDIHDGSLEREPRMQFYQPLAADPWGNDQFMIRTRIDPAAVLPAVEETVWRLDPEQPVSHPQLMERLLQSTTLDRRFEAWLVGGFAAAALFLATMGIFSIASLSLTQRTREFGVRLALGARGSDILVLELLRTLVVAGSGIACGVTTSLALGRTVGAFLYGVTPWSLRVYGVATVVLMVPAVAAAWLPARCAAKVDPMVALRYE